MSKKKVYFKYSIVIVFTILFYFFTKTDKFTMLVSQDQGIYDKAYAAFFLVLWGLATLKYTLKLFDTFEIMMKYSKLIYYYMDMLLVIFWIYNILYFNICFLGKMFTLPDNISNIVVIMNAILFFAYTVYKNRNKFSWRILLSFVFLGLFIFNSNSVELLILDLVLILVFIFKKLDSNERVISFIDKLVVAMSVISLSFLIYKGNIWLLVLNYISIIAYIIYSKKFEPSFKEAFESAKEAQKVINEKLAEMEKAKANA